jgi:hypothetical protein
MFGSLHGKCLSRNTLRACGLALGLFCLTATEASAMTTNQWGHSRGGFWVDSAGTWREWYDGKFTFTFKEVDRTADTVLLHDTSRDISVLLTATQAKVYQGGQFKFAYNGAFTPTLFSYNGGEFRSVGGGSWEEWQGGRKAYSFVEKSRSGSGATLYDASRGITVVITATQFTVYEGDVRMWSKAGKIVR